MAGQNLEKMTIQKVALPLHIQKLDRALKLDPLIRQVEQVFQDCFNKDETLTEFKSGVVSRQTCLYNFNHVTEERKWVQDLLLSNSEGSESELSDSEQLQIMLELQYKRKKRWRKRLKRNPKLWKFKYFSAGLLSSRDSYPDHVRKLEERSCTGEDGEKLMEANAGLDAKQLKEEAHQLLKEKERYQQRLWSFITKKEIPKMAKQFATSRHNTVNNNKRVAQLCQREVRKVALKSQRASKEVSLQPRARRLMREALIYWRRYERVEKEQRKKAEREALEQRKIDDEMREARRQQRKLNFLITQTELYAHFMAKKLTGKAEVDSEAILKQLEDMPLQREVRPGVVVNLENPEEYDSDALKAQALANVQMAVEKQKSVHQSYVQPGEGATTDLQESFDQRFSLATPALTSDHRDIPQPSIFKGVLKAYQLRGMNWLADLYDQGINGILADEMGLGKTVQSIALLAHLAERQNIWGPFLIVAPASTLHNWQQECTRFVPRFKVLPYWGSPHERKIIRKYWSQKLLYKENAPFHILITSYQLVVQDIKYFHRVKWQYMILDEAQAIKSSSSVRWKVLLSFNCRNRLLLTGTPIQNTMQELWALLHFVMPTIFDSHEEFNEWFSKDIESHAEKRSGLDADQLSRLHLILKPFMLRRIKKDVEHEMAEKIEVHLSCNLSMRQRRLYHGLRQRISIEDLLQYSKAQANSNSKEGSSSHLLNLVMQFRKVCNHPDLFERREVDSPILVPVSSYSVPRLVYHEILRVSVSLQRLLTISLGLHSAERIYHSHTDSDGCWTFLRLMDTTPHQASTIMLGSLTKRLCVIMDLMVRVQLLYQQRFWKSEMAPSRWSRTQLLLWPEFRVSHPATTYSSVLSDLVFTGHSRSTYAHTTHRIFPLKTSATASAELTEISSTVSNPTKDKDPSIVQNHMRHPHVVMNGLDSRSSSVASGAQPNSSEMTSSTSSDCSPLRLGTPSENGPISLDETERNSTGRELLGVGSPVWRPDEGGSTSHLCMPTELPRFLIAYVPKVQVPLNPLYCSERSAEYIRLELISGGPRDLRQLLYHGKVEPQQQRKQTQPSELYPSSPAGLDAIQPANGWSHIHIPDKDNMIYDSGKMAVLDKLLAQLKREGHRVLVYSQMTRMIDLLEEFMAYRRYKYIRLDGSSRIADRRDMVDDFQTKSDIFIFLLSTRAGGLGINLTAADTVIFYDSDWNPTVDQQAMDRAHRLGQTKQVTVYRLIVKDTIEERILQRAREKSEIQKMVISGGNFRPDDLKPKEMVSLLLDDEEMETRFLVKQAEKKAMEQQLQQGKKSKSRKRKNPPNGRENEPFLKRPIASGSPSPLIFSRPGSVMSEINGEDTVDVVGSTDGSEEPSRPGSTPVRQKGSGIARTSVPLGGRGRMHRKRFSGAGSGSAAASAGALAGALAANSAAYVAYGVSPTHISPSPINSLGASPASNLHGNSTHSSPRVSPVPSGFIAQTPPGIQTSRSSLLYTNSIQ